MIRHAVPVVRLTVRSNNYRQFNLATANCPTGTIAREGGPVMDFFYLEYVVLAFAIVYFARKMREESRTERDQTDHSTERLRPKENGRKDKNSAGTRP